VSGSLLLDTNIVIWILKDDDRISASARRSMSDSTATLSVSVVSVWEIAIKNQSGKLVLGTGLDDVVDRILYRSPWTILPVKPQHLTPLAGLPMIHKDPFDRLLVAQAQYERLTLVTPDGDIAKYDVRVLW
jgi:PIN domain nuclease of toxin-antitoxin system